MEKPAPDEGALPELRAPSGADEAVSDATRHRVSGISRVIGVSRSPACQVGNQSVRSRTEAVLPGAGSKRDEASRGFGTIHFSCRRPSPLPTTPLMTNAADATPLATVYSGKRYDDGVILVRQDHGPVNGSAPARYL